MPYDGSTWDETNPTNATLANEIDDVARDMKIGTRGRVGQEHIWPSSQAATSEAGGHIYVSLQAQTSTPTTPVYGTSTQNGVIFSSSGGAQLAFVDKTGTVTTIIPSSTGTDGLSPAGMVTSYAGTSQPSGWFMCTGGAISRATYVRLFTVVGTLYGSGDGSTTFNVPNLQGYTVVCKSASGIFASMAATTGELTHQLSIAEMPSHHHTYANQGAGGSGVSGGTSGSGNTGDTGGDGSHNNVQPSYVLNYIIKW